MAKINVVGIDKESYGKNFPTVFINKIEVLNFEGGSTTGVDSDGDGIIDDSGGLVLLDEDFGDAITIRAYLSLKFSKPQFMQGKTIQQYFDSDIFKDMCIYSFVTYSDWVKADLEQDRLSLVNWFESGHTGHDRWTRRSEIIKFQDLIQETMGTTIGSMSRAKSGSFQTLNVFDSDGDEIIEISNIIVDFEYYREDGRFMPPSLSEVENLMFFTFVGPRFNYAHHSDMLLDYIEGIPITSEYDYYKREPYRNSMEDLSQNSYYGDISYVHVLDKNRIASKFYEAYVTPDGKAYDKQVLQSINGKIYTTENISFDLIKERTEAVIDKYKDSRTTDADLHKNIMNLEAIINADGNRVGVLGEFANYRSVYPDKSPATMSGQFYNEFIVLFSEIIENVNAETELNVTILFDSMVTDLRTDTLSSTYSTVSPVEAYSAESMHFVRGVPYSGRSMGVPSECYIPSKWFLLSRHAILSRDLDSMTDKEVDELYGLTSELGRESGAEFADYFTNEYKDLLYGEIRGKIVEKYIEAGYDPFMAQEMADETLMDALEYGLDDDGNTMNAMMVFSGLNESVRGGGYIDIDGGYDASIYGSYRPYLPTLKNGDIKVKNEGIFFFDYEKALRTQSKISKVFDLSKLQQLFRFHVPYQDFFVKKVELSRNETLLGAFPGNTAEPYIRTKILLKMQDYIAVPPGPGSSSPDYFPQNDSNVYAYVGGIHDDSTNRLEYVAERIKYMSPVVDINSSSKAVSYLGFVNFDFPMESKDIRLEGYNSLDNYAETGAPMPGYATNQRIYDGYKMMCFKFCDIMDDDVALLNTVNVGSEYTPIEGITGIMRREMIINSNSIGADRTCYAITVEAIDRTHATYVRFSELIKGYYNNFLGYYSRASQICSYNNITNQFNSFFKSVIDSEFPDKPWETAAYVAHALSELLSMTSLSQEEMYANITETIYSISPTDGTLEELQVFATSFKKLVRDIVPDLDESDGVEDSTTVGARAYDAMKALSFTEYDVYQFYNEKEITEMIAGELINDSTPMDAFPEIFAKPSKLIPTIPIGTLNHRDIPAYNSVFISDAGLYTPTSDGTVHISTSDRDGFGSMGALDADVAGRLEGAGITDSSALKIYALDDMSDASQTLLLVYLFEMVFFPLNFNDPIAKLQNLYTYCHEIPTTAGGALGDPLTADPGGSSYRRNIYNMIQPKMAPDTFLKRETSGPKMGERSGGNLYAILIDRLFRFTNADNVILRSRDATGGDTHMIMRRNHEDSDVDGDRSEFRQIKPLADLLNRMNSLINEEWTGSTTGLGFGEREILIGPQSTDGRGSEPASNYPLSIMAMVLMPTMAADTFRQSFKHPLVWKTMQAENTNVPCYLDGGAVSSISFFQQMEGMARTAATYSARSMSYLRLVRMGLAKNAATMLNRLTNVVNEYAEAVVEHDPILVDDEYNIMRCFNPTNPLGQRGGNTTDPFSDSSLGSDY